MSDPTISVEQLGKIRVYDEDEQKTKLATLWAEKTAALVFIRHFG